MVSKNPTPSEVTAEEIWAAYEETRSIRKTADKLGLSRMKVQRALRQDPVRQAAVMGSRRHMAADDFEFLADEFLEEMVRRLRCPEERAKIRFKDLVIALGICTDKALLLRREVTQITSTATVDHDKTLAGLIQQIERAGGMIRLPAHTMARLRNKGLLSDPDGTSGPPPN